MSDTKNELTPNGTRRIPFGVGCFHFGIKPTEQEVSRQGYISTVRDALRAIPSISNLNVESRGSSHTWSVTHPDAHRPFSHCGHPIPPESYLRVSFDLRLSPDTQQSLRLAGKETYDVIHVFIQYLHHGPIAFVSVPDNPDARRPANAVIIARKHLESEFELRDTGYLTFEFTGPSPFHADFELVRRPKDSDSPTLVSELISRRGYDKVSLSVTNSNLGSTIDDLFALVASKLGSELDFYYFGVRTENVRQQSWMDVQNSLSNLLTDIAGSSGLKSFTRTMRYRRRVRDVLFDIVHFETYCAIDDLHLRESHSNTFDRSGNVYLGELAQGEFLRRPELPVVQSIRIAEFLEQRLSLSLNLTAAVVAAILGALIGASVTWVISNLGEREPIETPQTSEIQRDISPVEDLGAQSEDTSQPD